MGMVCHQLCILNQKMIINRGETNMKNEEGFGPLITAILSNNLVVAKTLLTNKSTAHLVNMSYMDNLVTPLGVAIIIENQKMIDLLVKHKADTESNNIKDFADFAEVQINGG